MALLDDLKKKLNDTTQQITRLGTQPAQTLYQKALANQPYSFWNGGNYYQGVDYTDEEKAKFKNAESLYNSGDVNGAMNLLNSISGTGRFGGFYDDDGKYYGFAQGYMGGANGSYQPVLGGNLISKGLEPTGTDIWLTPDRKAYSLGTGGALTDTGRGWTPYSYNTNSMSLSDIAARGGVNYSEMLGDMLASGELGAYNKQRAGSAGETGAAAPSTTPYQQALSSYNSGAAGAYTPTQPQAMSYEQYLAQTGGKSAGLSAPGAYDPESDTLWQQYLKDWANKQAPEYAGDPYQAQRDAALAAYGEKWGGSEYQKLRDQYLQNAANMEWNYNPDEDPVWQALQKQYRREGQRATEDTLGRYAAMTGGMPSTAAVTAASQAGNRYAAELSDRLPQVYQDAYNRYLDEYKKQLGISDAYAGFDDREYSRWLDQQGKNLDLANAYNQYGQIDYSRFLDTVDQFNKDRNFNYSAARDNQQLGRQSVEDQYKRYLDALSQANYEDETAYNRYRDTISDQRYDQEWAQQLREYADSQNWKATEWQQYLREYGDKLSQQEKEWAMQQAQYADDKALAMAKLGAQYGDYSGLSGMGIDTSGAKNSRYAYASDGSTYDFSTPKAQSFVNDAPAGATMKGSDGSTWRKDEYGGITITTKNGKTFTYSNPVVPEVKSGSGYRYSGGGSGSESGSGSQNSNTDDIFATLDSLGYTTVAQVSYALRQMGLPQDMSMSIAKEYVAGLNNGGDQGSANDPTYANLEESLDRMAANNRSRDEIFTEIDAEVKDGRITKEQGDTLKNKYYGAADNVPNSNQTHSGGRPQSAGFNAAYQAADTYVSRGDRNKAIQAISDAYNAGKIHEYEIDIIMDRLGL